MKTVFTTLFLLCYFISFSQITYVDYESFSMQKKYKGEKTYELENLSSYEHQNSIEKMQVLKYIENSLEEKGYKKQKNNARYTVAVDYGIIDDKMHQGFNTPGRFTVKIVDSIRKFLIMECMEDENTVWTLEVSLNSKSTSMRDNMPALVYAVEQIAEKNYSGKFEIKKNKRIKKIYKAVMEN